MTQLKNGDFVEVNFNIYANDKLVQTTNEKLGKEAKLNIKEFKPLIIILGKSFVLKALDEDIIKSSGKDNKLELSPQQAYGKRDKKLFKTFSKSAFVEQKMNPIPGMTYDFNGMFGTVKSVVGGRVMVDFNNPHCGKSIKLEYSDVKKITKISDKISTIFEAIIKIPQNMFQIEEVDKNLTIKIPQSLFPMTKQLEKSFSQIIPEIKEYKLTFEKLEIKK